ncbi:MAG: hypothetical protein J6O73_02160, partial [Lachnospiraceae bacterium]|nr:hypothetical protein [Lachnospiraceae bacterium]
QAYINEVIQMQYGDLAYRVKIVHKDDVEANLEGVDNTVYELYRNNIDTSSIFEGNECFFVDVDGNGTPELVADLGNRLPFMYYIDSDGNVQSNEITGMIEGEGRFYGFYSLRAEIDEFDYWFEKFENGQPVLEYSLSEQYDLETGVTQWTMSYSDGTIENISEEEFKDSSNTDAYKSVWDYQNYTSLLDAWQAYNN